jgi:hypothetical protein
MLWWATPKGGPRLSWLGVMRSGGVRVRHWSHFWRFGGWQIEERVL